MTNYRNFYLSMALGILIMSAIFYAHEFGFLSFNFFLAWFPVWFCPLVVALSIFEGLKGSERRGNTP